MAVTEFDGRGGNVYGAVNVIRRRVPTDAALANRCGPARDRVCLATVASNANRLPQLWVPPRPHRSELRVLVRAGRLSQRAHPDPGRHPPLWPGHGGGGRLAAAAGPQRRRRLPVRHGRVDAQRPPGRHAVVPHRRLAAAGASGHRRVGRPRPGRLARGDVGPGGRRRPSAPLRQTVSRCRPWTPITRTSTMQCKTSTRTMQYRLVPDSPPGGATLSWVWVTAGSTGGPLPNLTATPAPFFFRSTRGTTAGRSSRTTTSTMLPTGCGGSRRGRGSFRRNRWAPAVAVTGLEVTPLRSFYEGPLATADVLIADNVLVGGSEGLITACTGMEHAQTPPWATCTNITAVRNAYPPCMLATPQHPPFPDGAIGGEVPRSAHVALAHHAEVE